MDEQQLAAWQAALVDTLLAHDDPAAVRARLHEVLPWAQPWIAALDDRAVAVAIDLVRRWSPQRRTPGADSGREHG